MTKTWQCYSHFLAGITPHMNSLNLKFNRKENFISDRARPAWEFAGIKNSMIQINNGNVTHFIINGNQSLEASNWLRYVRWSQKYKNLKNILLALVNLRLCFNLCNTLLSPMLILSWHKSWWIHHRQTSFWNRTILASESS